MPGLSNTLDMHRAQAQVMRKDALRSGRSPPLGRQPCLACRGGAPSGVKAAEVQRGYPQDASQLAVADFPAFELG